MKIEEGFSATYGRGITNDLSRSLENILVVTMEDIWPLIKDTFGDTAKEIHYVETLEISQLERFAASLMGIDNIVGVGGGSVADVAKYFSWKCGIPLYQMPSIISVNACFTHQIAIRDEGRVRYVGDAVPEMVYVDYGLIQKAPARLNRAGIGDILSCHTGLYDWRLADKAGREPKWYEPLASRAKELLDVVRGNASEIHCVSEIGILTVMEVHKWVGAMCHEYGHPRFEEGSEHHFAYNVEFVTGKHILHGELVCLGILAMSCLQENDPEGIIKTIREAGVRINPEELGLTWDEMRKVLLTLKEYVISENLPYTIIHEKPINEAFIQDLRKRLAA